jgi:alcohol dehydrogenase (nicotinoprotein)
MGCNYESGDSRLDLIALLELYKVGRIGLEQLITQRCRLEAINQGFKDLAAGENIRGMIIY